MGWRIQPSGPNRDRRYQGNSEIHWHTRGKGSTFSIGNSNSYKIPGFGYFLQLTDTVSLIIVGSIAPYRERLTSARCPVDGFRDKDAARARAHLLRAVESYFRQGAGNNASKVYPTGLPPIYFQHRGKHSSLTVRHNQRG